MQRLNVFLKKEDIESLHFLWKQTREPIFGTSKEMVANTIKRTEKATERFYEKLDSYAVLSGLPQPKVNESGDIVHYGLDFTNGEIVSV